MKFNRKKPEKIPMYVYYIIAGIIIIILKKDAYTNCMKLRIFLQYKSCLTNSINLIIL